MLLLSRKSVEPMAASVDPLHASANHQSLHHFVAKAEWSDEELLRRVAQWVVPQMDFADGGWWIVDDTGFPKKGVHSVGVARQYCGMLGKQDNCQVAVSVSLACAQGSLPVTWRLYLPEDWAADLVRRHKAGVPEAVGFATKAQIALEQLQGLLAAGSDRTKKTSCNAACLRFPPITCLAGAPRAQRHVPDSIRSLRLRLAHELIARLAACPCCGHMNPVLRI